MATPTPDRPDAIISNGYGTIDTPSLDRPGNEPVPAEIFRDLLTQEWVDRDACPRPTMYVKDDLANPGQGDLARSDFVVVAMEEWSEQQRGYTYEYKDVEIPIVFEIYTRKDRQRAYNLMAEIRRIVYRWQRALRPFQQLYWDRFVDESEGRNRNWKLTCYVRATSQGVPVFTGVTTGLESPNVAPDAAGGPDDGPSALPPA